MITIFTTPRPFKDNYDIIQRNAIRSWLRLIPSCEIILVNDEENSSLSVAKEFGLKCIEKFKCNEFGTPIFKDIVEEVQGQAKHEFVAYVNTDIILSQDFIETFKELRALKEKFLMVGRRTDVDVSTLIDFENQSWKEDLVKKGTLHNQAAIDYFVFPKDTDIGLPPFIVGRPFWDGWFLNRFSKMGIAVVNCTDSVTVFHQNHFRKYGLGIKKSLPKSKVEEYRRNLQLLRGFYNSMGLNDAGWIFASGNLQENSRSFFKRIKRFAVSLLCAYPCFSFFEKSVWFLPWIILIIAREVYARRPKK